MRTSHQLLQVFVACALASATLPAAADAADDWVAYREANGLPVDPQPSRPEQLPGFAGPVPEAPLTPLDLERDVMVAKANGHGNGNGNGNGGYHWPRPCGGFFVELAKTDGDTRGESANCQ
jgi:hypothetical protein